MQQHIAGVALFVLAIGAQSALGIDCMSCAGASGSDCHRKPEKIDRVQDCGPVETRCANFVQIYKNGRGVHHVSRGCASNVLAMAAEDWNSCKIDGIVFIECSLLCNSDMCNGNYSFAPFGWSDEGDYHGGSDDFDYKRKSRRNSAPADRGFALFAATGVLSSAIFPLLLTRLW